MSRDLGAAAFVGPPIVGIRRQLPCAAHPVAADAVPAILRSCEAIQSLQRGNRVLVGVGSRGIASLPVLVRAVVDAIRARGAGAEILPSMGSHGSGTFEGQCDVLRSLGVMPEAVDAPFADPGTSQVVGETVAGGQRRELHVPSNVLDADGLILVNRVKPHTSFDGKVGSGLCKMLSVGLGGAAAARSAHGDGPRYLGPGVLGVAEALVACDLLPPLAGVAVVEDAVGRWAAVEAVSARAFVETDARLLSEAEALMARLPFAHIGLLVVEQMGKEISGTGMDTHVLARRRLEGVPDPPGPVVDRVVCLSLTPGSHGNATGVGLADAVSRRLADSVDMDATLRNVRASGFTGRAALPPVPGDDRATISAMLPASETERGVVVIHDTLDLGTIYVSEDLVSGALREPGSERGTRLPGIPFLPDGTLDRARLWTSG